MRVFRLFVITALLIIALTQIVLANGAPQRRGARQSDELCGSITLSSPRVTNYDPARVCRVVRRAPTPPLEAVESGLAYLLDIPLAMLSPITCPIVSPLMERFDSGESRTYARPRKR